MKKEIIGYPDYMACSDGRILSKERVIKYKNGRYQKYKEKYLSPSINPDGYFFVTLVKDFKKTTWRVSRVIAIAFLPNPENKPTVNHKNGIKTDNRIENLEWATYSENERHSYDTLGKINNRRLPILQLKDGVLVKRYSAMTDAANELGLDIANISSCCMGKRKSHGGFQWEYANSSD